MAVEQYRSIFEEAGKKHNVDPMLLETIAWQESRGNPKAVSKQGAKGLMQLMDINAKDIDPHDPKQAVDRAAQMLAASFDKGLPVDEVVGEYHGGPDRKIWGPKNRAYREQVMARYTGGGAETGGVSPDDVAKAFGEGGGAAKGAVTPQDVANAFAAAPETVTQTAAKPAVASPQKTTTSQALGFQKGLMTPVDNAAIWLQEAADSGAIFLEDAAKRLGVDTDAINRLVGLPSAREAGAVNPANAARDQRQAALAAKEAQGVRPGSLGEIAGNVIGTIPAALATRNPFIVGGASGALVSPDPTNLEETAKAAGWGAVGGKVGDMAMSGIGKFVSPKLAPAVQKLLGEGVEMTPGQMLGGIPKSIEDKMTSVPILGDMIQGARGRGLETFNRAALDRVLKPIGEKLPAGMTGRDAVTHVDEAVSKAYKSALTGVTVRADKAFSSELAGIVQEVRSTLPATQAKQFEQVARDILTLKMAKGGTMTADAVKEAEEKLGVLSRRYSAALDPDQRGLGDAYDGMRDAFRELVVRNNPQVADKLKAANTAFANLVRIEKAAAGLGAEGGVFTPAQLLSAVKAADSSVRKKAVAKGTALMQDLAENAKAVLPSKVPDSGTPGRLLMNLMAGGGLTGGTMFGAIHPGALAASLAAMAPYTKAGGQITSRLLGSRPAGAPAVRKAVEKARLPAAMAAGATAAQARPQKRPEK